MTPREKIVNLKTRLTAGGGAVVLALTLAACGEGSEPAATSTAEETTAAATGSTSATQGDAHNDADTTFAQMMIVHHQGAIEMADLAGDRAGTAEVRSLAQGISAAQGPEIERMTSWLEAWGEETTPMGDMEGMDHGGMEMDGLDQHGAMAELESLSGTDFDRRFLELMTAHHRGAVEMSQTELADGQNPQAQELARTIIDDQQAEIATMEQMHQNL
jgi:uncharacterized protein (DUF305 family)